MNGTIDKLINDLEAAYQARIQRARALCAEVDLTPAEIDEKIHAELNRLCMWSADDLINEFVDHQELLLRGLLQEIHDRS